MSEPLRFIPPRVQLTDPRTGMINREWYLFFQGVFNRIGGANGSSSNDLVQDMSDDAGLEETKAALFAVADAFGQDALVNVDLSELLSSQPVLVDQQTLDQLQAELAGLRDQVAELAKALQDLQQSVLL